MQCLNDALVTARVVLIRPSVAIDGTTEALVIRWSRQAAEDALLWCEQEQMQTDT
jgi:hypothetical protein